MKSIVVLKIMWEFVEKIIYINLDHREDRRKIMTKFFEDSQIPLEKVERFAAIKRSRGALGCLESHTEVLRMAKQNKWKNVLILEDDLEWLGGYERLEELTKLPNWDVIMLVGWYAKYDFPRITDAYNAGAYLVNEKYYDTFLQNREYGLKKTRMRIGFDFNSSKYDADCYWTLLQQTDNWYGLNPCICRQVDGFSDHCKKEIKASLVCGILTEETRKIVYNK
jgi:glycosyl transferase family 25